jgi:hypothetical protein
VTQVVRKGNRLNQVFVQMQRSGNGTPQLRHLQRMREAGAEQVAFVVQKNLRFVNQPPKRRAVHDAVTVALKLAARWRRRLQIATSAGLGGVTGVKSKGHKFIKIGL